jgi:hypothetical protein
MRFRTGLVVGGVVGYLVARRLGGGEESAERPSAIRAAMSRHPSSARFAGLANRASWKGVEAIQRARASIQKRLVADVDDLSMN